MEKLLNLIRIENKLAQHRAEKQSNPNSIGSSQSLELQPWLPYLDASESGF